MRHALLAGLTLLVVGTALAGEPSQRTLTFNDRVKAQEAIERVYYSHQIGATKLFEQAVPRAVLEAKVHKYLDETAALAVYWKTAVSDEMLQRELERMAHGTRMPERLLELYAALGNDPFIVRECLARAALVDRLAHNFYAFDPTLHAEARRRAERIHRQLLSGELNPAADHPNRSVVELVMSETAAEKPKLEDHASLNLDGTTPFRHELSPDEFRKQRAQLPDDPGLVSVLKEDRGAFVLKVVVSETTREVRAAHYVIPKTSWDDWWAASKITLQGQFNATFTSDRGLLPVPTAARSVGAGLDRLGASGLPCAADDTWANGILDAGPNRRYAHTAVWTGNLMVVWGGTNGTEFFNTGGRYDPVTDSWTPTSTVGAPLGRDGHSAVWTGKLMVVWGGEVSSSALYVNTGGCYDPSTHTWTPTSTTGAPLARYAHTAVWTGSSMVIWGGIAGAGNYLDTGGRYDPAADSWTPTATVGAPTARQLHTAVWTGSLMVVWGGYGGGSPPDLNTGGRYDPATDSWTPTSTTGAPTGRRYHTAVWTGSLMVVWGGTNGSEFFNTGGRYDPVTDTWTPTAAEGAPSGRQVFTAVWTGNLM